jgi:glycosyltransferase involved in cell wall biosynthesis
MMQFSVVIPTRNRPQALAACLASFARLDYPAGAWEIIVVNDGGDGSLLTAVPSHLHHLLPLKLIDAPHAGPAAARNRGAAAATFDHLAFTDDDCCVPQTGCTNLPRAWPKPVWMGWAAAG